eukprot:3761193-Pleurochrysis_carterae.AAC.2
MPSRPISFHFACTLAVFVPAPHVYSVRARPLRFEFPVSERMADVAVPCTPDRRQPAGAASPPAPKPVLVSTCMNKHFPARPDGSVHGLKDSVSTIDLDRARPLSGGFVIHKRSFAPTLPALLLSALSMERLASA